MCVSEPRLYTDEPRFCVEGPSKGVPETLPDTTEALRCAREPQRGPPGRSLYTRLACFGVSGERFYTDWQESGVSRGAWGVSAPKVYTFRASPPLGGRQGSPGSKSPASENAGRGDSAHHTTNSPPAAATIRRAAGMEVSNP